MNRFILIIFLGVLVFITVFLMIVPTKTTYLEIEVPYHEIRSYYSDESFSEEGKHSMADVPRDKGFFTTDSSIIDLHV